MPASDVARVGAAILFLQAGQYAMDAMGTLNSSPWTSENFGADAEKAKSSREYVLMAVGVGSAYCLGAAIIGKSWWPIAGAAVNGAFLLWVYDRALKRAVVTGSTGWASQ